MSINNMFQYFVTKEKRFFPMYIKQAEAIEKSALSLQKMASTSDIHEREMLKKEIKSAETYGDEVFREFYILLNNAFLTPFDQEDVHELAELMDNFLDNLDDCSNVIMTHNHQTFESELLKMIENIVEIAHILNAVIKNLEFLSEKSVEIVQGCRKIKHIEHENDEIFGEYISKLFENKLTFVEIIKRKDIIQVFENTTNTGKEIADKIRGIRAKNA